MKNLYKLLGRQQYQADIAGNLSYDSMILDQYAINWINL